MHYRDRVTGHQRQDAHQANTHNSRAISLASVSKTHNNKPTRKHPKTVQKSSTHKQYAHHKMDHV